MILRLILRPISEAVDRYFQRTVPCLEVVIVDWIDYYSWGEGPRTELRLDRCHVPGLEDCYHAEPLGALTSAS